MDWIFLIIAAFLAGALNAVAGGGTFLTLPALIYAGIPPVSANATSTLAVFPGYLGAAIGYRHHLGEMDRKDLYLYVTIAATGGLIGSLLLLISSNTFFSFLIPWLLLFATLIFAFGQSVATWLQDQSKDTGRFQHVFLFLICIYGGYFNGGLGIILLAAFLTFGLTSMGLMNGLKNGLSLILSIVSVLTFIWAGLIVWPQALSMMAASTIGGYFGARWAMRLPDRILRGFIIIIGTSMTFIFFTRQ